MHRQTVLSITADQPTPEDDALLERVVRAWPQPEAPQVIRKTAPQILRGASGGSEPHVRVALVHLPPKADVDLVDRLVEALHASGLAGVLVGDSDARFRPMQGSGVIVRDGNDDARTLASMLYALAERQAHVESITRELSLSQRCQAGVRAEVERIHEELHLAAGVQHEFTASALPSVRGIGVGVLYRPVNTVSGDIYNVRMLDDEHVAFFVADAVGHGVPAALLTMILTNTLITSDQEHFGSDGRARRATPGEVLLRINRRLVEGSLHTGRFATAAYGVINTITGEVVFSGAGHPAPLILGDAGVRELQTEGPLLGVFPDAQFDEVRTTLRAGESLVLYTDGLEAAFPRDPQDKRRRTHVEQVSRLFREEFTREDAQANDVLRLLETLLDQQSGSLHQLDDITALAITRERIAQPARAAA